MPCFCRKSVYTSLINLPAVILERSAEKDVSNSARGCNEDKLVNPMCQNTWAERSILVSVYCKYTNRLQ